MKGFMADIESDTLQNRDYRRVLYTGSHIQLVLMSLAPGDEIGLETHEEHDQFIRVEAGAGVLVLDGERHTLADGLAAVIPAGVPHNVINTSSDEALKLYSLYGPPEHAKGTVHHAKSDDPGH
jgi:mannose-6-phosphate isomerase-like protein (cupin superfamily)